MPAPQPLTLCQAPDLDWSRAEAPAAKDFGDIYFSVDGGLEETRAVFLEGCGLPQGWHTKPHFTIGELGFGSGLNFLAAWQMWEQSKPKTGRLHFVSVEKFPFSAAQLTRALAHWPELKPFADKLIKAWPGRVKGFHRLHFGDVTLTLIHDDVSPALNALEAKVDAWFLDGFSPSKNPDMWSEDILGKLTPLTAEGARLATFTVAGFVRQGLMKAGFEVKKKEGFGRKRERLEGYFSGQPEAIMPNKQPVILGAGIAGASLALAFRRRGITPKIISRGMAKAASGNAAAIIKPRLDLQDRVESRFFLSGFLYDLAAYETAGAILHRGIRHIPKDEKERERFEKTIAQQPLPDGHISMNHGAMSYETGLIIRPDTLRDNWLAGCEIESRDITTADEIEADGSVILAPGFGVKTLLPDLEFRFSRGQLTWAKGDVPAPLTYGGYAVPKDGEVLVGTTHDRLDGSDPFILRAEDDARNLQNYFEKTGQTLSQSQTLSRASIRVNTVDTLPFIRQLDSGQWLFTGLGSRGFVFAPLLAEALVGEILGEPRPIAPDVWARFHHS